MDHVRPDLSLHDIRFHFASGRGLACDFDLSEIFGNATIADCGITEFNDFEFMDCVEMVQDVDKPLGAR